jgi:hypothetical protein
LSDSQLLLAQRLVVGSQKSSSWHQDFFVFAVDEGLQDPFLFKGIGSLSRPSVLAVQKHRVFLITASIPMLVSSLMGMKPTLRRADIWNLLD